MTRGLPILLALVVVNVVQLKALRRSLAIEMGCEDAVIQRGFGGFAGVKRRFTRTGEWNGVTVIDAVPDAVL